MRSGRDMTIGRRQFVTELALGAFVAASFPSSGAATDQSGGPAQHAQHAGRRRADRLSLAPADVCWTRQEQDRVRVAPPLSGDRGSGVTNQGKDVTGLYFKDRQAHPDTRIYTLGPEPFVITQLFTPRDKPRLPTFSATVVRGHLEARESDAIPGLETTSVQVKRVVQGRMFDPKTTKPTALESTSCSVPGRSSTWRTPSSPRRISTRCSRSRSQVSN